MNQQVSEILTLDLTPEESDLLWYDIRENGFTEDLDGFKKWVMARLKNELEDFDGRKIDPKAIKAGVDFLAAHPSIGKTAGKIGVSLFKKAVFGK